MTISPQMLLCWIEERGFSTEVYTEREWASLVERPEYKQRMAAYAEQIDESDVEPFYRYVVDGPLLPAYGTYSGGVKAMYLLSGIRVPMSVAPFTMRPGDQALGVTSEGEVGLLPCDCYYPFRQEVRFR